MHVLQSTSWNTPQTRSSLLPFSFQHPRASSLSLQQQCIVLSQHLTCALNRAASELSFQVSQNQTTLSSFLPALREHGIGRKQNKKICKCSVLTAAVLLQQHAECCLEANHHRPSFVRVIARVNERRFGQRRVVLPTRSAASLPRAVKLCFNQRGHQLAEELCTLPYSSVEVTAAQQQQRCDGGEGTTSNSEERTLTHKPWCSSFLSVLCLVVAFVSSARALLSEREGDSGKQSGKQFPRCCGGLHVGIQLLGTSLGGTHNICIYARRTASYC